MQINIASNRIAIFGYVFATVATAWSLPAVSQPSVGFNDQVDQLVEFAQCIRENGYPDFPDPNPDGRFQVMVRMDQANATRFEAAQQACRDMMPSGLVMGRGQQEMTPERMEALLAFSACMRDNGVGGFPDPSSQGAFEISSPNLDLSSPRVRQTMESCREAHGVTSLLMRQSP